MKIKKERKRIQLRREYLLTLALSSLINASQKRERKRGYLKINRTDVLVNTCAEGRKREKERGRARRNGSDSVRSTGSFAWSLHEREVGPLVDAFRRYRWPPWTSDSPIISLRTICNPYIHLSIHQPRKSRYQAFRFSPVQRSARIRVQRCIRRDRCNQYHLYRWHWNCRVLVRRKLDERFETPIVIRSSSYNSNDSWYQRGDNRIHGVITRVSKYQFRIFELLQGREDEKKRKKPSFRILGTKTSRETFNYFPTVPNLLIERVAPIARSSIRTRSKSSNASSSKGSNA